MDIEKELQKFQSYSWAQGMFLFALYEAGKIAYAMWGVAEMKLFGVAIFVIVIALNAIAYVLLKRARAGLVRQFQKNARA